MDGDIVSHTMNVDETAQVCFNKPCTEPLSHEDLELGVQVQHDWDDDTHQLQVCLRCDMIRYNGKHIS
jgi:hypothetical protein